MTDSTTADVQDTDAGAAQDATNGTSGQDSQPTGFDALPPETQAEIRKLRKENATARKRLEEFENAGKTELERRDAALKAAEERASTLEGRLRDLSARSAVTEAATTSISPRAVYALIQSDIEFDDEGKPTNVDALIKQAQKDEPSLFRAAAGSGDGGKGGVTAVGPNLNDMFRELARNPNK